MAEPEVLFERRGKAGIIILNRPKSLNAFGLETVQAIRPRLADWAEDPSCTRVIIRANGDRAFAAGGDVRAVYDLHMAGKTDEAIDFWRQEYLMNSEIHHFPKPYIALIEGYVMGGGVGLSSHGTYQVAGDKYQFAMPEVSIGLFPDVGGTYLLPRLPGKSGTWLALTGARIGAAEAIALGLVTHRVPYADFPAIIDALADGNDVEGTLDAFTVDPGDNPLAPLLPLIDRAFAGEDIETILENLKREARRSGNEGEFAQAQIDTIRTKSPLSVKIALEQMLRGGDMTFNECMRTEYRIVNRVARGHDFYEGVRAIVVDKDNKPKWRPASEATAAAVLEHFEPVHPPQKELELP
jgi:enoyl-CoA hydratase